jgi:glycosyltransferase involved in cell wall biosynthesis
MKISVIIPTLNEEFYIDNVLECLGHQTHQEFEVIIVDGHSIDRTVEIGKRKRRYPCKLLECERGLSRQRNYGVKHSEHAMLLFLDADITIDKYFLEESIKEIHRKKISIAIARIKPDLDLWHYRALFMAANMGMKVTHHLNNYAGGVGNLFVSRRLFNKLGGYDEEIFCCTDVDLTRRARKFSRMRILNTSVTYSTRRYEKYGAKKLIWQYAREGFLFLICGARKVNQRFRYEYGEYPHSR